MSISPPRSWAPVAGKRGAITISLRTNIPLATIFVVRPHHVAWWPIGFEENEAGLFHQGAVVLAWVHAIALPEDVLRRRLAFLEGGEAGVVDEGNHRRGERRCGECDSGVWKVGRGRRRWNVDWRGPDEDGEAAEGSQHEMKGLESPHDGVVLAVDDFH